MKKLKRNWKKLSIEEKVATLIANALIMSFFTYMAITIMNTPNVPKDDWRLYAGALMIFLGGCKLSYDNFLDKPMKRDNGKA